MTESDLDMLETLFARPTRLVGRQGDVTVDLVQADLEVDVPDIGEPVSLVPRGGPGAIVHVDEHTTTPMFVQFTTTSTRALPGVDASLDAKEVLGHAMVIHPAIDGARSTTELGTSPPPVPPSEITLAVDVTGDGVADVVTNRYRCDLGSPFVNSCESTRVRTATGWRVEAEQWAATESTWADVRFN